MIVGSLLVCLRLPGAETLKDKRKVVHGMLEKLRRRFGVSAAEVGDLGLSGNATVGLALVTNNRLHAEEVLVRALEFVESHPEVEVYDLDRSFDTHGAQSS